MSYQERAKLGFWDQEIFISLYRCANIKAELGYDADDVIQSYFRPIALSRAEPRRCTTQRASADNTRDSRRI